MAEAKPVEEQKDIGKRNWADEEDDAQDDEDVEIGGDKVAQIGDKKIEPAAAENGEAVEQPRKQVKKPRQNRERNIHGDFVVTKFNIKEREVVIPMQEEEEEEESSEESEEEEQKPEEPEEEVKKGKFILKSSYWRAQSCANLLLQT